jgi:hypothetical protein
VLKTCAGSSLTAATALRRSNYESRRQTLPSLSNNLVIEEHPYTERVGVRMPRPASEGATT